MSNIPTTLKYTTDHEWLRHESDGQGVIGITDHAQDSLGDITFVELPEPGASFASGEAFGVVESVKAASDLYMPVDAEILEVNEQLLETPEAVNTDAYGEGWIVKVRLDGDDKDLLSPEAYGEIVGSE